MAVNTNPVFANASALACVSIATANTNRDGSGTLGTLVTGDADGTLIEMVRVVATGTTTAGVVRIFLHDGSNFFLLKEVLVTAITPSTSVEVFTAEYWPTAPLVLPNANWTIQVSTHNAEEFDVTAFGGILG